MRRALLVLVGAIVSLVLIAFLVPFGLLARSVAEDRAVTAATFEAQSLASLVGVVGPESIMATTREANSGDDRRVSVFLPDGSVLGAEAERTNAVELASRGRALSAEAGDGRAVLIPVGGLPGGTAVVRVLVPGSALHKGVTSAYLIAGGTGLALLILSLVVADQLGRRMVRSVGRVAGVADKLAGGDLSARVEPDGPPEVRRVGTGLNRLAGRIRELLAAEREEVADLSHRLRTPVTALRLDADSLRDPAEAARIGADTDALERVVDEVIRAARRPVREGARAEADLAAVVIERVEFWSALAADQGRQARSEVPDRPVPVRASAGDLTAACDALLGNVFAHTPEGSAFTVTVTECPDSGARLVVDDAGPGFPDGDMIVRGRSDGGSTGLGLDIAGRTARASGGEIELGRSPSGGARITVEFGPPQH